MPATVEFHTGVEDPLNFACRLLRKAARAGSRVLVTAPPETLAALDERLWSFDATSFVAHARVPGHGDAGASSSPVSRAPIWLAAASGVVNAPPVLVNLGADPPEDSNAFTRVIEVVGSEDGDRQGGRARWRHYESWGVRPLHHGAG